MRGSPYQNDGLLTLRGLAALCVVCHHAHVGAALATLTGVGLLGAFAVTGSYPVYFFFCISGYLMAKILAVRYKSAAAFYWNRAARILPTYYLAIVVTLIVTQRLPSAGDWPILLLVANYVPTHFPNAPLWSLSTECQFYLIAPAIAAASARYRWVPVALLAGGAAFRIGYWLAAKHDIDVDPVAYEGLGANIFFFASGWCAFTYRNRVRQLSVPAALSLCLAVLVAGWFGYFMFVDLKVPAPYTSPVWMLVTPAAIAVASFLSLGSLDSKLGSGDSEQRSVANPYRLAVLLSYAFGVLSYSVYVLHNPLVHLGPGVWGGLLLSYAAAFLVYYYFERPLYRLRTRRS